MLRRAITVWATGLAGLVMSAASLAQTSDFIVDPVHVADEKAVFATVQSIDVAQARARLSGTIGDLRVDEGDRVQAGQVIAVVVDEQLAPQLGALNAQVAALTARLDQARADLARAEGLFDRGLVADARLEAVRTEVQVLDNQVASARQQRAVTVQRAREGDVLAPASGVVLRAPLTAGAVVMPGELIAEIAAELYVLRLSVPERHARFIQQGDEVRLMSRARAGAPIRSTGTIRQVYPQIEAGRVTADAVVDGLGDFFVGERVRVRVQADPRTAILIPDPLIETRYGLDYVRIRDAQGGVRDVVVQRGPFHEAEGAVALVEILSGLRAGDRLVTP